MVLALENVFCSIFDTTLKGVANIFQAQKLHRCVNLHENYGKLSLTTYVLVFEGLTKSLKKTHLLQL